ncbi:50S ribosomal protein L25/general stress protein Ctc [Microcoleus sp. FACHB-53]|jgi:large subunit ribosomal protein L25|nr:50S ribosomal protein L25/general stress protein Ctc [Microcoleus sp. FACHB-53]MBD2125462.1 50S ribosomal protein L25/general stress protein Ctc [Microcoleus sp. FACHB-1]
MEVSVECQKRPEGSKPGALRRSGLIPAVLYGHKGTESVSLTLPAKTAETLLKKATVNNTLVQVNIPDISWNGKALLREVQTHPWKRSQVYHLSFFSVASQDSLEVTVPLHFLGQAAGLKLGGILDPVITEIQVQCAPGDIPESIDVDVSNLEIGDSLHVSDLVLPEGITPMLEPETTIVIVGGYAGSQEETEEASEAT